MTTLIDESVPARLAKALSAVGCRVSRFPNEWKGLQNGELLRRVAASGYSCLITCDKNLRHQQTVSRTGPALVVLPYQRFDDLVPFVAVLADAVKEAEPGDIVVLFRDGTVMKS